MIPSQNPARTFREVVRKAKRDHWRDMIESAEKSADLFKVVSLHKLTAGPSSPPITVGNWVYGEDVQMNMRHQIHRLQETVGKIGDFLWADSPCLKTDSMKMAVVRGAHAPILFGEDVPVRCRKRLLPSSGGRRW